MTRYMRERGFDDYDVAVALVGPGPRGLLGLDLGLLRRRGRLRARAGVARDAGRRVVPGRPGQLRRAPVPRQGPGRDGDRARVRAARAGRAELGRAARAGGADPRRPARARRRARRPRRGVHAEHPRDGRRVPGDGVARRGVVELLARLRRPLGDRPLRADRAEGAAGGRRLPLQRARLRPPRDGRRHRRRGRRPASCASATWTARAGRRASSATTSWSSSACRSTTRCGSCTRPARPACRRRSSRARAGSCSSTSRSCTCTSTRRPATASSGSRRPAG